MKHLKLFESFNQDKKIEKVNDFILYFLISSYFEKNTEVIAENDGYTFYVMKRVKGTLMKKSVLSYDRVFDLIYFYLNSDFLRKRLKRHLRKCLGDHHFLEYGASADIVNTIKNYCVKKLNITNIIKITLSMYHNNLYETLKTI